jgi:hypothetical protein
VEESDTLYHWALEHHDDAEYEDVSRRDRDIQTVTDVSHGRFQWEVNCCRGCGNRVGPPTWYKDGGRWYYLCPECNKSYARADSLAEELENPKKIRVIRFRRRNEKAK